MITREPVLGQSSGTDRPQEVDVTDPQSIGITVYPVVTEWQLDAPVTYPNATHWKGHSGDALNIHEGDDVIAVWDAGRWDHAEVIDARTRRDTTQPCPVADQSDWPDTATTDDIGPDTLTPGSPGWKTHR